MKIWHVSDLHYTDEEVRSGMLLGDIPVADVAVIAGDVSDDVEANIVWCVDHVLPRMPVIYVPGNHDLYRRCINGCTADLRRFASDRGVTYLDIDTAVIAGVRFTGGLLWSDLELWAPEDPIARADEIERRIVAFAEKSDYVRIYADKAAGRFMTPRDTRERHLETVRYLEEVLSTPFDGETVVVTHFPPHPGSLQPEYMGDEQQPRYISDRSALIEVAQPAMWLHGHTHMAVNYRVGRTIVANNPRGYGHEKTGFRWDLVHDLAA
ncbi:phosphatase [Agrobacterium rubi]|nr:phosphatase [Agrobacterium rubi]NTF24904.1 phosphatase [Agrobacterium rubi]